MREPLAAIALLSVLLLAGCSDRPAADAQPICADCGPVAPQPENGIVAPRVTAKAPPSQANQVGRARMLSCLAPCNETHEIPGFWEPHGVGNPNDPNHMVIAFRSSRADGIETLVTRDGGQTWSDGLVTVGPASASPVLRRYTHSGDASVAILGDGTVLVAGLGVNVTEVPDPAGLGMVSTYVGRSIYVARSLDGGLTFPEAFEVMAGSGRRVAVGQTVVFADWDSNDKEWIAAASDGTVLVAWTHMPVSPQPVATDNVPGTSVLDARYGRDVMAAVSRDGGATFGDPVVVEANVVWAAAHPAITTDGSFAIAYGNLFGGALDTYTSTDGIAWERHATGTTASQPVLLHGDTARTLHLAYATAGEDVVPILRTSLDGGKTFGNATVLAGDIGGAFSHVAYDRASDGSAIAAWYRQTPDETLVYEARGIRSDGSLTPVVPLASGLTGPSRTMGDYVVAVSAHDGGGLVAWVSAETYETRALHTSRLAWTG